MFFPSANFKNVQLFAKQDKTVLFTQPISCTGEWGHRWKSTTTTTTSFVFPTLSWRWVPDQSSAWLPSPFLLCYNRGRPIGDHFVRYSWLNRLSVPRHAFVIYRNTCVPPLLCRAMARRVLKEAARWEEALRWSVIRVISAITQGGTILLAARMPLKSLTRI